MTLERRSLTIAAIRSALAAGRRRRLFDGGNLVLLVYANGRASWLFRYSVGRSKREMGLGAYDPANRDGLSLVAAREAADEWRAVLRRGLDPIEKRRRRDMPAAGPSARSPRCTSTACSPSSATPSTASSGAARSAPTPSRCSATCP